MIHPISKPGPKPKKPRRPLKRSGPPKRKARVRRRNPERKTRRFERHFASDEFVQFTRRHPCLFCGRQDDTIRTAHVLHSRGAGGGPEDCGPACGDCDGQWENAGRKTFLRRLGLSWREVEYRVAAHWTKWLRYERASVQIGEAA